MELFHLRYFMTVAKYENFSKAADELYISQPSISKAVLSLEKELGVQLFIRHGKRVQLSETGLALKRKLEPIMSILDNLPRDLKLVAGHSQSTIVLNVLAASSLLPDLLVEFKQKHPFIDFQIIQNARTTKCDLSIRTALPGTTPENSRLVMTEEIMLAVPMTSHLALKESVRLSDLHNETFITLGKRSPMREISDYFFDKAAFTPHVGFESDNPGTIRGLVCAGLGISMWPEVTWGKLSTDLAKLVHISDPLCHRNIYVTSLERNKLNDQTRFFLDFLINYFRRAMNR
jgi:LysR family transcriptional activator of glutamate synthase operon